MNLKERSSASRQTITTMNNTANSTTTKRLSTRKLVLIALMTAITCIFAPMAIPIPVSPVPISLTNLVIMISIYVLGFKDATISYIVYLLLGLVGLPVFSGGAGGFNCLFSPTGGYLWGFIVSYPIASYLKGNKNSFKNFFLAGLAVIPITYIFGVAMLCFIMKLSILEGITIGALPFIPGDIIKTLIASYVAVRLRKNLFY